MAGLYQRNVAPASANTPGMTVTASQGAAGGIPRGAAVSIPQGQTLDVRQLGGLLGMLRNGAAGTAGAAGVNAGGPAVSASPRAQAQSAWNSVRIGQTGALNPYAAQGGSGGGSFGPGLPLAAGTGATGLGAAGLQPGGSATSGNTAGGNTASGFSGAPAGNTLPGALAGVSGTAQSLTAMPGWLSALTGGFNG